MKSQSRYTVFPRPSDSSQAAGWNSPEFITQLCGRVVPTDYQLDAGRRCKVAKSARELFARFIQDIARSGNIPVSSATAASRPNGRRTLWRSLYCFFQSVRPPLLFRCSSPSHLEDFDAKFRLSCTIPTSFSPGSRLARGLTNRL